MENVAPEFIRLQEVIHLSRCDKKQIAAGTYANGEWYSAPNYCEKPKGYCVRLEAQSGTSYEGCGSRHAEANLAMVLKDAGVRSDGEMWLLGHYWACEPCAAAVKAVGVRVLHICETLPPEAPNCSEVTSVAASRKSNEKSEE